MQKTERIIEKYYFQSRHNQSPDSYRGWFKSRWAHPLKAKHPCFAFFYFSIWFRVFIYFTLPDWTPTIQDSQQILYSKDCINTMTSTTITNILPRQVIGRFICQSSVFLKNKQEQLNCILKKWKAKSILIISNSIPT